MKRLKEVEGKNTYLYELIYYNEESNVSVRNSTRGHKDVPASEGVPEVPYGVLNDCLCNGAAP